MTQKAKKWLKFFVKTALILGVLFFVSLFVLSSIGGKSDMLQDGFESFVSRSIGHPASVETFNSLTFYPYFSVDVEGLRATESPDNDVTVFSADKVQLAISFWDILFRTGHLKTLNVQNLQAAPGVLMAPAFRIDRLSVLTPQEEQPRIDASGMVGGRSYSFSMKMEQRGEGNQTYFVFPDKRRFNLSLGDLRLTGILEEADLGAIDARELELVLAGLMLQGEMAYRSKNASLFNLSGDLVLLTPSGPQQSDSGSEYEGNPSRFTLDLDFDQSTEPRSIRGDVTFDPLYAKDIGQIRKLVDGFDQIADIFDTQKEEKRPLNLTDIDLDLEIRADPLRGNHDTFGDVRFDLDLADGTLTIVPGGQLADGELGGEFVLNTAEDVSTLAGDLRIQKMDYGILQRAITGGTDMDGLSEVNIKLAGQGVTLDEIRQNLNGHAGLIAGKGRFPVSLMNTWGGGLVNAMLPDLSPEDASTLNCGIADFKIEKSIAEASAIIIDTEQVTIKGSGTYDIAKDQLDLQLKPDSKGVALGDVSNAMNVSGPLFSPSVSPSAFDFGKRLGGLLLGTINPAFFALTLTDLGLGADSPCHQFLSSGENSQASQDVQQ